MKVRHKSLSGLDEPVELNTFIFEDLRVIALQPDFIEGLLKLSAFTFIIQSEMAR